MKKDPLVRFNEKWTLDPETGCWLWTACKNEDGYGMFYALRVARTRQAHRYAWILMRGPIPAGLEVDHICRVRHCVNPDHLRLVTHYQNVVDNSDGPSAINRRKTHCPHGHPYSADNVLPARTRKGKPGRRCKTCTRMRHQVRKRVGGT